MSSSWGEIRVRNDPVYGVNVQFFIVDTGGRLGERGMKELVQDMLKEKLRGVVKAFDVEVEKV